MLAHYYPIIGIRNYLDLSVTSIIPYNPGIHWGRQSLVHHQNSQGLVVPSKTSCPTEENWRYSVIIWHFIVCLFSIFGLLKRLNPIGWLQILAQPSTQSKTSCEWIHNRLDHPTTLNPPIKLCVVVVEPLTLNKWRRRKTCTELNI